MTPGAEEIPGNIAPEYGNLGEHILLPAEVDRLAHALRRPHGYTLHAGQPGILQHQV